MKTGAAAAAWSQCGIGMWRKEGSLVCNTASHLTEQQGVCPLRPLGVLTFFFCFSKEKFSFEYLAFKLLDCKAVWSPYPQPPFLSLSLACPRSWFGLVVFLLLYSELPQIHRPTVQTLTRKGSITQWIRRRPPVRHACIWISAMVGKWPLSGWNRQSVANLRLL